MGVLFGFLFLPAIVGAQHPQLPIHIKESGFPFYERYTPDIYGQDPFNNVIVQGDNGLLYIGNKGLLIYDGSNWDYLSLPNKGRVMSLAKDRNGKIYVGGNGELGYLDTDSMGNLKYVSLLEHLDAKHRENLAVWQLQATPQGVFFNGLNVLLRWKDDAFTAWPVAAGQSIRTSYADQKLYVQILHSGKGLHVLEKDTLRPLKNGARYNDSPIRFILPFKENQVLIGTNSRNLELYDSGTITPFKTEADDFLTKNILGRATRLRGGNFAIATLSDGLVVIDTFGRQLLRATDDTLSSSMIVDIFQDREGNLWIATSFGITKLNYRNTAYSKIGHEVNVRGWGQKANRFKGRMVLGTEAGLFVQDSSVQRTPSFFKIGNSQFRIHDLIVFKDQLLVAGERGIYELKEQTLQLLQKCNPLSLKRSKLNDSKVLIGTTKGLMTMEQRNGQWQFNMPIPQIKEEIYTVIEMTNGNLWLGTNFSAAYQVSFQNRQRALQLESPQIARFDSKNGHPNDVLYQYKIDNQVYFSAKYYKKMYRFNKKEQKFYEDGTLASKLGFPGETVFVEAVDNYGTILFSIKNDSENPIQYLALKQKTGTYIKKSIAKEYIASLLLFYDPLNNVAWFAGKKGTFRYDLNIVQQEQKQSKTIIRKVGYQTDSILFGGYKVQVSEGGPSLPHAQNNFSFNFSNPSFFNEFSNTYQYRLDGYDENWSSFSTANRKEYTNLPKGTYTFRVRSKNSQGNLGEPASYHFKILSPWYLRWWAYTLYLAMIMGTVLMLWKWKSTRLTRKNYALENLINERTGELAEKNSLLLSQTNRLKELDSMKTRLFANISHEFRTPLTLIKGPIDALESSNDQILTTSNVRMIRRNADRLLKLVNQLLDLSKLDNGKLKLNPSEGDIFKCIRSAASSFSSHAAQRGMDYQVKVPSTFLWVAFDRDKLEKIMYNLLSNAFKFTNDGAAVKIAAVYKEASLHIKVTDYGQGIAPEGLGHIFNRFFQMDDSYTREKQGSGIGLALTKELVELMQGEIYVESELGKGSSFKVVLPMEEIKSHKAVFDQSISKSASLLETPPITAIRRSVPSAIHANKILIVEDNEDMRFFIEEQLKETYEIIEATNGEQGLEKAIELVPDLIITDVMMPKIDGITLCKRLKSDRITSHIPIIMLTAKAGVENKIVGLEMGADVYLTKPFNGKEVKVRVKNLILERAKLRKLFGTKATIVPSAITVNSMDEAFLKRVLRLLEEQHRNPDFGVPQMQMELGISKTQLHRKLKSLTDHAPGELMRNFRLKRAAQLLEGQSDNVSQIAYAVGFNSLSYFTKCFKELYGVSPSAYKNAQKPPL